MDNIRQYHAVWNSEHHKWVLKKDSDDIWIRSSFYKWLLIRKCIKYCNGRSPCELIIHAKDGHTVEARHYH